MQGLDWRRAAALVALMGLPRVGPATALAIATGERDADDLPESERLGVLYGEALDQITALGNDGVRVLGFFDDLFPSRLRLIPSPPAVIYVRGTLDVVDRPALAVVGTREPTSFGRTATRSLTLAAAQRGIVIVSGLALGIDALAHEAALERGTRTLAALGSGVDRVTPRKNARLAERIVGGGGALLSEQPPGTPPSARTLVARNRLQAALGDLSWSARQASRAGQCTRSALPPSRAGVCGAPYRIVGARRATGSRCCSRPPRPDQVRVAIGWRAR